MILRKDQIKKITSVGDNIYPTGDYGEYTYNQNNAIVRPNFTDIAVSEDGIIYVTELNSSRIYQYDQNGKLLSVFGGEGNGQGKFLSPTAIEIDQNGYIYILDTGYGNVQVLKPTLFIQTVIDAIVMYENGEYDASYTKWQEVLKIHNSGFSKQSDVVYGVSGNPLTDLEESRYLLNPITQTDRFEKDLKITKEAGANIAFEKFGKTLYEDFNKNHALSRYDYKNAITEYLESAGKSANVATDGYLAYMSGNTDYILNLTDDTSNLFIWAKEVPFLQMVLHGSIPYSSALPGNLASDITATKLKWIEYGYIPTFILTGNDESLIGSNYDKLFSSGYIHWKDTIIDISNEMKEVYEGLANQYIVQHEIENNVAHLVWSDGTEFVINHNTSAVDHFGTEIAGQTYLVIKNTK